MHICMQLRNFFGEAGTVRVGLSWNVAAAVIL